MKIRLLISAFFFVAAVASILGAYAVGGIDESRAETGFERFTFTQEGTHEERKYWIEIDDYEFRFIDAFLDVGMTRTQVEQEGKLTGDCANYVDTTPGVLVDGEFKIPVVKLAARGANAQCIAVGKTIQVGDLLIHGGDADDSQVSFSRPISETDGTEWFDTHQDDLLVALAGAFLGVTLSTVAGYWIRLDS
jgi:hypothetical protein